MLNNIQNNWKTSNTR